MSRNLSTTSYAVLGMLSLRPWTPYDLTQQMQRSLAYCWPTSERVLYTEPERLVEDGYARVEAIEHRGRERRRYVITDAGRQRLADWLATTPEPPRFHNEAMLRLLFADQATPAELLATIDALRSAVEGQHSDGYLQMQPYLDGEGPFPERAHLIALFADLYERIFTAIEDWCDDAATEVATWDATKDLGLTQHAQTALAGITNPNNQ